VRLYARIALLLGVYLLVGGLVYAGTANERMGAVLLLVGGGGFAYVGLYARRAVRAADRAAEPGAQAPRGTAASPPETEAGTGPPGSVSVPPPAGAGMAGSPAEGHQVEEVRPTIWPLVFSLAGAGLVAGVLASHWILIIGGLLALAAAAGWFREVLSQRHEHG
jgi:hypothetical protein